MMHVTCYNGNRNQMEKKSTKTIVGFISTYFKLIDFAHLSRSAFASTPTSKRLNSFLLPCISVFFCIRWPQNSFFANLKCLWNRKIICHEHFFVDEPRYVIPEAMHSREITWKHFVRRFGAFFLLDWNRSIDQFFKYVLKELVLIVRTYFTALGQKIFLISLNHRIYISHCSQH